MTKEGIEDTIKMMIENSKYTFGEDFIFGEYLEVPNMLGVFKIENSWFIYDIDEKKVANISGPFKDEDIIYATAFLIHKSEDYEQYKFDDEAKNTFLHSHYRSLDEAKKHAIKA